MSQNSHARQCGDTYPNPPLANLPEESEPHHNGFSRARNDELPILGWRERIRHFTWAWFTLTMATGGLANVIYSVPLRFPGLYTIGCIFFILNLVFFLLNCLAMSLRFYYWPSTFRASFLHPTESLFVPACVISIAVILMNVCQYGLSPGKTGLWLEITMTIFYWIYVCLAVTFSVGIYLLMWSTQSFTIAQMTPVWIFPAYPLLLVGPFAGVLSSKQTLLDNDALEIIVSGIVLQGIGFMVSLMIYAAYLYRLFTHKLPAEGNRPGMFISVGPSAFTVSALIAMGYELPQIVPANFMGDGHLAGQVGKIMAYWVGIWLWGLAIWFFFVSVGAHWSCVAGHRLRFAMTWYAFIFPNTALITATFAVAKALDNYPIKIIGCIMTCLIIVAWLFIVGLNVLAVTRKQILWPQKQEDSETHLFRKDLAKRQKKDLGTVGALGLRVGLQSALHSALHSTVQSTTNSPPSSRLGEKAEDVEKGS